MKTGTVAHLYPLLSITYPPTIGLIAYPIDVVNKEDRIAVVDGLSVYPSFLVNIEKNHCQESRGNAIAYMVSLKPWTKLPTSTALTPIPSNICAIMTRNIFLQMNI